MKLKQIIENPMIREPSDRLNPDEKLSEDIIRCEGCNKKAIYALYGDKQPHCKSCTHEAIYSSKEPVLVGRL